MRTRQHFPHTHLEDEHKNVLERLFHAQAGDGVAACPDARAPRSYDAP